MAWVAAEIREKFDQTVNRMGLEPQAVMNDIMWHVIHNQCLPSDIKTPNAETLEAFAERDLEAKTLEETFAEWDAEDAEDAKANRNDEQVQEGPSTRGWQRPAQGTCGRCPVGRADSCLGRGTA